mmetsp:Transcript_43474/g.139734  ORF Transcript_43474/g.139734 Transcript_43474/m.139734 type:complete len:264 (+) Transcript_43474:986-1777(+)
MGLCRYVLWSAMIRLRTPGTNCRRWCAGVWVQQLQPSEGSCIFSVAATANTCWGVTSVSTWHEAVGILCQQRWGGIGCMLQRFRHACNKLSLWKSARPHALVASGFEACWSVTRDQGRHRPMSKSHISMARGGGRDLFVSGEGGSHRQGWECSSVADLAWARDHRPRTGRCGDGRAVCGLHFMLQHRGRHYRHQTLRSCGSTELRTRRLHSCSCRATEADTQLYQPRGAGLLKRWLARAAVVCCRRPHRRPLLTSAGCCKVSS